MTARQRFKLLCTKTILLCFLGILPLSGNAEPADNLNKGVYLVATKRLNDTGYEKSVIFITEHGQAGTYGIMVNRETQVLLEDVVPEARVQGHKGEKLYFGGPMHAQFLFVLTNTKDLDGLHKVTPGISFGAGKETVARLNAKKSSEATRTYAGFSSWGPGELEQEINSGIWVLAPGEGANLFDTDTTQLWQVLFDRWAGSWI